MNSNKPKNSISLNNINNTIFLTVYMESQCPDTTSFIKRQLMPTFENLINIERINYTIVPFGKATCDKIDNDFV